MCAYNNSQTPKTNYMKKVYLALAALSLSATVASAQAYIGETEYATLQDAVTAAEDGAVIEIAGTVNTANTDNTRLGFGKNLTIKGRGDNAVLQLPDKFKKGTVALLHNTNHTVTFENLTFDGRGYEREKSFIEAKSGNGTLNLTDVTVINNKMIAAQRLLDTTGSGAKAVFTNLVIKDCEFLEGLYPIRVGGNKLTFKGNCEIQKGVNFEPGETKPLYYITVEDLTNTTPIAINFDSANTKYTQGGVIVKGCNDPSKFKSLVKGYTFEADGDNLKIAEASTTGIEGVEADENAPVEYYNLQGVRVANPENGIFIRRQGAKVEKVYVK